MRPELPAALLLSLGLTLLLELPLGWALGLRGGRNLALAALVNGLTNPPVALLGLLWPHPAVHLLLEAGAVLVEGAIYARAAPQLRRPMALSLALNGFSFTAGLLLRRCL